MTADRWLADTRISYDTVAASYADQLRDALAGEPYLRAALALFAEMVHAAGGGPVADVGCGPGHVRRDLGLPRRREHPPCALPNDLVDQRRAVNHTRWRILAIGDYREHGRTLPTRIGARASLDSWTLTRREGIQPPDEHPQASSIARALRLEAYVQDAERDGDGELVDQFRRAQADSRKGAEQGKQLLRSRLTA